MLRIEQVDTESQAQVHRFVEFPYRLFATSPQWVPPLFASALRMLDRETHPLYEHYDADFFIAVRDGRDVGRIAVYGLRYEGTTEAKFYLFDCENDIEAATALFERAFEWARQRGMKTIMGPKGFTLLDGNGILIKGVEEPPIIETMPYNDDYYIPLIEAMGFEKLIDQDSYSISTDHQRPMWLHDMADWVRKKEGLHIKHFSTMPEMIPWGPRILETLKKALNYPLMITREDAFVMDYLKNRSDPRLIKGVMYGEEMVGVCLAIPNISAALQRTRGQIKIDQLRQEMKETDRMTILAFGFVPDFQLQGISVVLFAEIDKIVREIGLQKLDILWVTETTVRMKNDLKAMAIQSTHTHRVYRRDVEQPIHALALDSTQKRSPERVEPSADPHLMSPEIPSAQKMQFSLFYFSSNEAAFAQDKYQLFLEGSKFADQHDFSAIWIPERHFHAFGGLYPNPSLLATALAMTTQQIRLRAGSVVLPLHHPIRVAEEWAVVDNLSQGRVDLSFATGWNPKDFVLSREPYEKRVEVTYSGIERVQKLWRGESISPPNRIKQADDLRIYPQPQQKELNIWLTCSGGPQRFIDAGRLGYNVLTALLFQPIDDLAKKIVLYREARAKQGYDPETGHVTLMLHTYIGQEIEGVRDKVRGPFIDYLKQSANLWLGSVGKAFEQLSEQEQQDMLSYAFERYYQTSALIGTPQTCLPMVERLKAIGVNEIACLIDFGVEMEAVLGGLNSLNELKSLQK